MGRGGFLCAGLVPVDALFAQRESDLLCPMQPRVVMAGKRNLNPGFARSLNREHCKSFRQDTGIPTFATGFAGSLLSAVCGPALYGRVARFLAGSKGQRCIRVAQGPDAWPMRCTHLQPNGTGARHPDTTKTFKSRQITDTRHSRIVSGRFARPRSVAEICSSCASFPMAVQDSRL